MTARSGRSMCDLIRKPGPGCISAVFGFLAVPPILIALAIAEAYLLPPDACLVPTHVAPHGASRLPVRAPGFQRLIT